MNFFSPHTCAYPDTILPKAFIPDPADKIMAPCEDVKPR